VEQERGLLPVSAVVGDTAPRRVLLVAQPLDAGVPRHVLDLVDSLDPARFQFDVVCPRRSMLWSALEHRPSVQLYPISPGTMPSLGDVWPWLQLLRLVRRADAVHAHSSKAGFLVRTAALVTGRTNRCAFTPHAWSFYARTGWQQRLLVVAERLAGRWCRIIIAVSDAERREGLGRRVGRPDQYRVVVNGVDLERFARPRRPQEGRVVMISRLSEQKRPERAVHAIALLRHRRRSAHLVVLGDGPLRAPVEQLVSRLGVSQAVELLGDGADVPEHLSRASCLVLTSDYEGCPLSVLEAMAAGVPVVATATPATSEVIEDGTTGFLVDSDPDAIARGIERVLSNEPSVEHMGARARERAAQRFSRARMVEQTARIYDELMSG
jgi:glycosyltransferase involved in cell wall biosynthesis